MKSEKTVSESLPEVSFPGKQIPSSPLSSDIETWRAFKGGNESAFILIYKNHYTHLVNYGINFTKDRELIRDCIQDMFLELRETRKNLSDTDAIKPYLFKVFRRKISLYLKNNYRFKDIESEYQKFEFTISYEQHLINRQISEHQIAKLNDAIAKLSTKEREAIFHFYFELHSYQQIADIMGYTQVKTARTLVYRAIASLKSILEPSSFYFLFSF